MRKFILIIMFAALGASSSIAGEIKAPELRGGNRIGILGKCRGERTVIEGELGANDFCVNPFKVVRVDGVQLSAPVVIEIRGKIEIRKGVRCKLEGYESGGFEGSPHWLNPMVQQPFQFHAFFVVTKIIEPPPITTP